jgi:hypothetical protein
MNNLSLEQKNKETLLQKPITRLARPSGFIKPVTIQDNDSSDLGQIHVLAAKVLKDPLLLIQLSHRVYELMLEDLSQHQEPRIY